MGLSLRLIWMGIKSNEEVVLREMSAGVMERGEQGQWVRRKQRKRQKKGGREEVGRAWERWKEPNKICSKCEGCHGNYFLNGI